ncbi:MAG: [protein-PII] uridylyltransferase [Alphaproteobacteria bacterium]
MTKLRDRRAIIDRLAVQEAAEAAIADASESERPARLLTVYRAVLETGHAEIRRRFDEDSDGSACVAGRCFLIDQLLRVMHDMAANWLYPAANPTAADQLAIVAYGGYGRGELAPHSDIDLLFLLPYKQTPRGEQIVEHMLYTLWDMGLKVGHATRSIDDCIRLAKADVTICTGLLEARFIWGTQRLFLDLRQRFQKQVVEGGGTDFVIAKLAERDERHEKMGDSRYVLEPNVKDGKGGLRDLQTLFWIAKHLYRVTDMAGLIDEGVLTAAEARQFAKAQDFLWTVRCHIHYQAGRPDERLTFDLQPTLARRMGYTDRAGVAAVERFMKHYFLVAKEVGDLTRIFCAALEARQQRGWFGFSGFSLFRREVEGFPVEGGRLRVTGPDHFANQPRDLLRLFEVAHRCDLDIHPDALQQVTRNLKRIDRKLREDPEANRLFMAMLTAEKNPEITLRRMNEAGVFGRFIPDFGRVVAQMQYDMYHVYTTDEHTIRAIGILNRIERGELAEDHPLASEIIHKALSRRALYASVLMHDIAKGRGGDHSELGEKVAMKLCPRLGLTPEETETVAWLVRFHLAMSHTAFKRDLSDYKTVADFVRLVQSPERLRLLLCLTVVDIRAVGPGRWNSWKAVLLRDLYYRAEEIMGGAGGAATRRDRVAAVHAALDKRLADWDAADRAAHYELARSSYWLGFDTESLARHARFIRETDRAGQALAVDTRVMPDQGVTEVTVYAHDHPGLFSRISGALAVSGANIVDARINTLANGMALDAFTVQDAEGGAFARPDKLAKLATAIEQSLAGRLRPLAELSKRPSTGPTRARVFRVEPRVLIDNKASNTNTVIEVNGRDRPGLLYDVTRALTDLALQITSAKISTYGEVVVDVFYVKDVFGMKVEHDGKLEQIRDRLLMALADPNAALPPAKPERPAKPEPKRTRRRKPAGEAAEPAAVSAAADGSAE